MHGEIFLIQFRCTHPPIEVSRHPPTRQPVVSRINIIRSHFKWLHLSPTSPKGRKEREGHGRLPDTTMRAGNENPRVIHEVLRIEGLKSISTERRERTSTLEPFRSTLLLIANKKCSRIRDFGYKVKEELRPNLKSET